MKKAISISFLVVATLILFTLTIIPHHHHEGRPCFWTEHHEKGKAAPDEDGSTTPNADHNPSCCAGTTYTVSTADQRTKEHIALWSSKENDFPGLYLSSFSFIATSHTIISSLFSTSTYAYREHSILFYQPAELNRHNGLRAPPSFS
jgi:hypothetical protein